MKKRIIIEIIIGVLLAGGLFYWLYVRPLDGREALSIKDPRVGRSIVSNRDKVLVIGVSGMTWDIAMDLVNDGRMPNLARMVEKGSHGVIKADSPYISPAVWNTYITGRKRQAHGIDNYSVKIPFRYHEVRMTNRFRRVPAVWEIAEFGGRSVGLVNWSTIADPPALKDSVIIAEGFGPDSSKGMVHPPSWKEKALSAPVPRFLPYEQLLSETGDKKIINAYESDRKIFAMAFEIMEEKKPDLMMVRFHNLEMVSQMFYKYARPYSLDHYEPVSKEERDKYADVMAMHYEFVDRLIGGLLGLSKGYTVIVVSEHGLGPAYPPHNIFADLNSLMERMGHLDYYGSSCEDILTRIMERGELKVPSPPSANIFAMCQKLENETRKWVADGKPKMAPPAVEAYIAVHFELADPRSEKERERRKKEMVMLSNKLIPGKERKDIMWKRTRVWNVEDTEKDVRGLYINLAGREPEGVVDRDNFHSFRKKVIKDLKRLRTENGNRLFKSVRANPRKDVNPMTLADSPDILVKLDREPLLHNYGMQSPNDPDPLPLAAIRTVYSDVSALPTNDGLIAISGKNASTFQHVDMKALDFAPTVLWLLGLPASADMPGEAKKQAFDKKIHNRSMLYIESWEEALKMRK